MPMNEPIASVVPERKTPTIAPTAASGSVVSMIVIGWMKLSNCDASTM